MFLFHPHLTRTQSSFFFLVHSVWLSGKLLTLQKAKTQFDETEQASKPDTAEMLDLSNQKYKRTIIC